MGPLSDLTEEVAECIVEFNDLDGDDLSIREFTQHFNEIYGTSFSTSGMHKTTKAMGSVLKTSI